MKLPLKLVLLCSFCGWQVYMLSLKNNTLIRMVSIGLTKLSPATMTFQKGRIQNAEYVLRTAVPTIYQCAELCLLFTACSHFNFIKGNNENCFIIKNKSPNYEPTSDETDYKYMAKQNIPTKFAGSCANHTCGEYETCVRYGIRRHKCQSVYQCADGVIGLENNCTEYGGVGGCDNNNIGKDLIKDGVVIFKNWSLYNWMDMIKLCNRTCKQCL